MGKIYVIGHKNPDTDTVVSAITMAEFWNKIYDAENYFAAIPGKLNSETQFIFDKFGIKTPDLLEDATGKKLFLVDHNEQSQWVNGAESDNILGFVDHHKINFNNNNPIEIITKPWGSTNTIIHFLFSVSKIEIPKELKPLILCAILSDTVILKSPTTTKKDKEIVESLSKELGIDYKGLGMEMFKAKAKVAEKNADEIINNDFKNFDFNGKKVGIGQIETPDIIELDPKINEIISKMNQIKDKDSYHTLVLMLTDIIKEGSKLLVVSADPKKISSLLNAKIENNISEFMPGVMSRKKQIAPKLSEGL